VSVGTDPPPEPSPETRVESAPLPSTRVTVMARVLVLFAHPAFEKSRVHRRLVAAIPDHPDLTFQDLYEAYPRLDIDVGREQELLLAHDVIVLQHPLYWYSTPPILKQWQDLVLEHGWAYGSTGTALQGKSLLMALSAGGRSEAYCTAGYNRFTIRELLTPIEQTAILCRMRFLPPFVVFGTHRMSPEDMEGAGRRYRVLLEGLLDDRHEATDLAEVQTMNTLVREWAGGSA